MWVAHVVSTILQVMELWLQIHHNILMQVHLRQSCTPGIRQSLSDVEVSGRSRGDQVYPGGSSGLASEWTHPYTIEPRRRSGTLIVPRIASLSFFVTTDGINNPIMRTELKTVRCQNVTVTAVYGKCKKSGFVLGSDWVSLDSRLRKMCNLILKIR